MRPESTAEKPATEREGEAHGARTRPSAGGSLPGSPRRGARYRFKPRKKGLRLALFFFDLASALLSGKRPLPDDPRRILIVRLDSLGDVLLTLPFIAAVRDRFPRAKLTLCISPPAAEVFYGLPFVERVVTFSPCWFDESPSSFWRWLKDILAMARYLRAFPQELVFEPRGDLRILLALKLARLGPIVSFGSTGGRHLLAYDAVERPVHRRLHPFSLLGPFSPDGFGAAPREGNGDLYADFFSRSWDRQWTDGLKRRLGDRPRPWIVVHPFAGYASKQWPLERFARLIVLWQQAGATVFLVGSHKDRRARGSQGFAPPGVVDLVGRLDIRKLHAFLGACDLFVGNDSGPAHLAAIAGVKTLVVFSGTNDPRIWKPCGPHVKVLSHPVPCSPCEEKRCLVQGHPCLSEISVHRVYEAGRGMLERGVAEKKAAQNSAP